MKKILIATTTAILMSGCSVYKVLSQADPANLEGIGVGTPRQLVINQIGAPKMVDTDKHGNKQDYFEFESGHEDATKLRAIAYLGTDVITLSLAELIWWPLELTALEADKCIATATYDADQKITAWNANLKQGGICE